MAASSAKRSVAERRAALTDALRHATSPLDCAVPIELDDGRQCVVRPLKLGDEPALCHFGLRGLSQASRDVYGPYNWASEALSDEFSESIRQTLSRQDLHLVAETDTGEIVSHGFLWAAQAPTPELGIAVADAWHGCGLGRCLLLLLEVAALITGCRAIELTTVQTNERARRAYESVGYEMLGIIRNPVGCDVTAAFAGLAKPTSICDEFQLVRVLIETEREDILAEMAAKRSKAIELFGSSGNK